MANPSESINVDTDLLAVFGNARQQARALDKELKKIDRETLKTLKKTGELPSAEILQRGEGLRARKKRLTDQLKVERNIQKNLGLVRGTGDIAQLAGRGDLAGLAGKARGQTKEAGQVIIRGLSHVGLKSLAGGASGAGGLSTTIASGGLIAGGAAVAAAAVVGYAKIADANNKGRMRAAKLAGSVKDRIATIARTGGVSASEATRMMKESAELSLVAGDIAVNATMLHGARSLVSTTGERKSAEAKEQELRLRLMQAKKAGIANINLKQFETAARTHVTKTRRGDIDLSFSGAGSAAREISRIFVDSAYGFFSPSAVYDAFAGKGAYTEGLVRDKQQDLANKGIAAGEAARQRDKIKFNKPENIVNRVIAGMHAIQLAGREALRFTESTRWTSS